jgi:nicotinamidase-related amidase
MMLCVGEHTNPAAKPAIERIGKLADAARSREDWIVVYGNDAHRPGDVELRLPAEHAMAGTPGAVFQPLSEEAVQARQERALDYLRTFYRVRVVPTGELLG